MDEEIDRLVVSVRADIQGFAKDIVDMRGQLEGSLGTGAERAGRMIEGALERAVRTGKFGFDDLRRIALGVINSIASDARKIAFDQIFSGAGSRGGILGGVLGIASAAFGGAPGRATGGPVSAGRAYTVGENGPELFVPGANGRIVPGGGASGVRDVRVTINVSSPDTGAPQALARSARQIAKSVRGALAD